MDDNLDLLEARVVEAVALIGDLRTENHRLAARCDDLAAQVAELEAGRQRLAQELADAKAGAGDIERYEEKRKEIEDRVGGLIRKLSALG